jgi:hypothetical protein
MSFPSFAALAVYQLMEKVGDVKKLSVELLGFLYNCNIVPVLVGFILGIMFILFMSDVCFSFFLLFGVCSPFFLCW